MKRKSIALLLVLTLLLSLAACSSSSTDAETEAAETTVAASETEAAETEAAETTAALSDDPLEMITQGYYQHCYTAEGYGEYCYYFHFYEEIPVLGAVFYAGLNNNRSNFAGTYTVEETPFEYSCYPDRQSKVDKTDLRTDTAPYTITFYDWDGNQIGQVGYDGDVLYNVMDEGDTIYAQGSGTVFYLHDTTGEKASYYENEVGVPYLSYVADDTVTSTLAINHDGSYTDLVNSMVEGTWTVAETDDGGLEFTLTPTDSWETGAVVVTSADKQTCTYTPDGGESVAMSVPTDSTASVICTFTGVYTLEAYGIDADVVLYLYDDETCAATMSVAGNDMELASGTYTQENYTFTLDLGDAGTVSSEIVDSNLVIQLTVADTSVGDVDVLLTRVSE